MDYLYENIFNSINDGIAIYNNEGHFLEVNLTMCRLSGYSKKELLQMNVVDLVSPDFREKACKNVSEINDINGEIVEMTCQHKDGSITPVEVNVSLFEYVGNRVNLAVIRDITQRKLAETELEKSREQFMLAVKGSHDGIWDWDLRDNSMYLSSRFKEIIGYEDDELQNMLSTLVDIIHPDDKKWVMDEIEIYMCEELPEFKIEVRAKHKNGGYVWTLIRGDALRYENGVAYRMAGSITDITKRKQAEIEIYEEALRRRVLIEQSYDGIVVFDQEGKVLEANKKYADLLGYSSEEVLKLYVWDWDALFSREKLQILFKKVDNLPRQFETRFKRKDGILLDVEVGSNTVAFGDQILTFCVCRDITVRKQQEKELMNAIQIAESSNEAKSQFIANMSHELRTPLNAIIGFSEILLSKTNGDLTDKQTKYLNNINVSGKHLLEVINDVLDISRIEAGQMELERSYFSFFNLFEEIETMITPFSTKKNISIEFKGEIRNDRIFADRLKLKQIMLNIISNAIKFTSNNGLISIRANEWEGNLEISISDTGIGIPNHHLKDIFNPFTQVDTSNRRSYGGAGLGLAIVKQFVEIHKGNVWVKSEEGKGSTFIFIIPVH